MIRATLSCSCRPGAEVLDSPRAVVLKAIWCVLQRGIVPPLLPHIWSKCHTCLISAHIWPILHQSWSELRPNSGQTWPHWVDFRSTLVVFQAKFGWIWANLGQTWSTSAQAGPNPGESWPNSGCSADSGSSDSAQDVRFRATGWGRWSDWPGFPPNRPVSAQLRPASARIWPKFGAPAGFSTGPEQAWACIFEEFARPPYFASVCQKGRLHRLHMYTGAYFGPTSADYGQIWPGIDPEFENTLHDFGQLFPGFDQHLPGIDQQ